MENTSPSEVRQDNPPQKHGKKHGNKAGARLRGAPLDMVCPEFAFRDEMGISEERWKMYVDAGLPLIPAGRICILIVSEVVEFLKSQPKLGQRPSEARKQRYLKRKAKPK